MAEITKRINPTKKVTSKLYEVLIHSQTVLPTSVAETSVITKNKRY